jgi:NAD(P)-dependent dehydrogenase (short-subunit alcohol dehydrogenase family)
VADGDLGGRVTLVTGGSGGIVAELASRMAASGAAVGVHSATNRDSALQVSEALVGSGGAPRRLLPTYATLTHPIVGPLPSHGARADPVPLALRWATNSFIPPDIPPAFELGSMTRFPV